MQSAETSSGRCCRTWREVGCAALPAQRTVCRKLRRQNSVLGSTRVATAIGWPPTRFRGAPPSRVSGVLPRWARRPSAQPSRRRWPARLPNGSGHRLHRPFARTAALPQQTALCRAGSRPRRLYRRPPSLAPYSDPGFDFTCFGAARLPRPRVLDFVEEGQPVTDVLFEYGPDFLLHRASVTASQGLERLHDFGGYVSHGQGCHVAPLASIMLALNRPSNKRCTRRPLVRSRAAAGERWPLGRPGLHNDGRRGTNQGSAGAHG